MELHSPSVGLLFWTLLSLTILILCIIAIVKIANDKFIEPSKKVIWLLAIIIFPIIGALTFIAFYKKIDIKKHDRESRRHNLGIPQERSWTVKLHLFASVYFKPI